ncbi:MAG: helix-turn-helix transcriptional regulator [Clostridia bacterium]|nr:helix-turn-helix transcriptional regulator [Clostridia bacterium]
MSIGKKIRKLREAQGYTIETLAQAAGVAKGTVARLEMGAGTPRIDTLEVIAKTLGTTLEDLIAASDIDETDPAEAEIQGIADIIRRLRPEQRRALREFLLTMFEIPKGRIFDLIPKGEANLADALVRAADIAYRANLSDSTRKELFDATVKYYGSTEEAAPFAAHDPEPKPNLEKRAGHADNN